MQSITSFEESTFGAHPATGLCLLPWNDRTSHHFLFQDGVGSPPPEVPLGFDAEPELLTAEEWRAKYIISSEQYEILCERPEDLSPKEQLQEFLFEMVTKEYKVDPNRVDHDFYTRFCADEDEAKATREAHANYLR